MVGLVVVSHSARLAAGVAELAREMGGEVRLETAGGLEPPAAGEESPLGTDATRVMSAIEAADDGSGDGVLVLMDLGSAVLSAEMAVELLDPELGERVRLVAAPLVEGAVAAAVAAGGGAAIDAVAEEARGGLAGKAAHLGEGEAGAGAPPDAAAAPGATAPPDAATAPDAAAPPAPDEDRTSPTAEQQQTSGPPSEAVEERFVVTVAQGLHARPAAQFVRTAAALSAQIEVENATTGAGPAPAGSLNAIATLGVREGHELIVRATGPDAREAVQRLREVATGGGGGATARSPGVAGSPAAGSPSTRPPGASPTSEAASPSGASPTSEAASPSGASPTSEAASPSGASPTSEAASPPGASPAPASSPKPEAAPPPDATHAGNAPPPDAPPAQPPPRPLPPDAPPGALAGIPSSPGIVLGPLRRLDGDAGDALPPIAGDAVGSPDEEWAALTAARAAVGAQVEQRRDRLAREVGAEEAEILDALVLVLDDDALLGPARAAVDAGRSAARGWADAVEAIADRYRALDDPYQRERAADVVDVGRRVLRELAADRGTPGEDRGATDADRGANETNRGADAAELGEREAVTRDSGRAIVVARDLTPIDAAGLDRATVAGIATAEGGPTSHGAILARALGVPAVVGLGAALLELVEGSDVSTSSAGAGGEAASASSARSSEDEDRDLAPDAHERASRPAPTATAILDGDAGLLVPAPSPDTVRDYRDRQACAAALAEQARAAAHDPATTRDGVTVEVAANAGSPADARAARAAGADGIGLFRTEFAFLGRDAAPTEEQQAELYGQAAEALGDGRPLVIRTLDAGADKPLPYLGMPPEANPFLGVRGLRLGLARPELLRTQLRAIVRTAAAHANVKLMFPMVATIDELRAARALLEEAIEQTGATPRDGFEVGIMVEVPAAALTAVQLAREVDFFSLGTNDLTQYTLAAERGNAALAALADGLHPAILRLVDEVCRAARAHGRWVGVCGELAADPLAAPLLVGLGVRELSVAAPSVAAVKQAVRALDADEAAALARAALAAESAAAVRTLVVSDDGPTGRR